MTATPKTTRDYPARSLISRTMGDFVCRSLEENFRELLGLRPGYSIQVKETGEPGRFVATVWYDVSTDLMDLTEDRAVKTVEFGLDSKHSSSLFCDEPTAEFSVYDRRG